MKDVIVIPTYNEAANIESFVREVFRVVPEAHVLVVDDSSPDGTADIVRKMQQEFPQLELLVRKEKTGLGSAYITAFKKLLLLPDVRTMTTIDADWSHNPAYLKDLHQEIDTHDMVIGSRYTKGGGVPKWEMWRRFLSWGGNQYARLITGVPVNDLTAGYVCFSRQTLSRIDLSKIDSEGYAYTIESKCFAYHAGARIKEIPIIFEERRGGESKISSHIIREGLLAPWRIRLRRIFSI